MEPILTNGIFKKFTLKIHFNLSSGVERNYKVVMEHSYKLSSEIRGGVFLSLFFVLGEGGGVLGWVGGREKDHKMELNISQCKISWHQIADLLLGK